MRIAIVSVAPPYRGGISLNTAIMLNRLQADHTTVCFNYSRQYPEFLFPGKTQYETGTPAVPAETIRSIDSICPRSWYKTAKQILMVVSSSYIDLSGSVEEWLTAFESISKNKLVNSFAIRVSECPLNHLLPQIHFVDLVGLNKIEARNIVIENTRILSTFFQFNDQNASSQNPVFLKGLPKVWNIPYQKNPNFT